MALHSDFSHPKTEKHRNQGSKVNEDAVFKYSPIRFFPPQSQKSPLRKLALPGDRQRLNSDGLAVRSRCQAPCVTEQEGCERSERPRERSWEAWPRAALRLPALRRSPWELALLWRPAAAPGQGKHRERRGHGRANEAGNRHASTGRVPSARRTPARSARCSPWVRSLHPKPLRLGSARPDPVATGRDVFSSGKRRAN